MRCSLLALSTYVDSEAKPKQVAETEAHIVGCDRCRRAVAHLREASSRIGALAHVHVDEDSVAELFVQLRLSGPGQSLPPRTMSTAVAVRDDAQPWLNADEVGRALPWRSNRPDTAETSEVAD
jgi:anti-sigma factor RsiW